MPITIDELHAADLAHAQAIAAIEQRLKGHDAMFAQVNAHLSKLDESVAVIREKMGNVATKDDFADLRKDISNYYAQQLAAAHNSIPAKFAAICAVGTLGLAALSFALAHFH
jgi:predicted  nucleic acid-binding Zn-ribbon protein